MPHAAALRPESHEPPGAEPRFGAAAMTDIVNAIRQQIADHPVLLYMKGTPQQPRCGFSARTIDALVDCGERFAYVDILDHPEIRASLPAFANWPTFPQLWINGELVGGCDIVAEMHRQGELKPLVSAAANAENGAES